MIKSRSSRAQSKKKVGRPAAGGKGGGRPDNARGGGKDVSKLDEALSKAKALLK